MHCVSQRALGVLLLAVAAARGAGAATITLDAPLPVVDVQDGDDFATTVLGDPWDFDKRRDFLYEEHFTASGVSAGNWLGTISGSGANVYPLFQGFPEALPAIHLDLPEFGVHRPIDAARYTELSYRLNTSQHTNLGISWTRNGNFPVSCGQFGAGCNPEAGALTGSDGFYLPGAFVAYSGWTIYDIDLRDRTRFLGNYGVDWAGQIRGLQLAPSASAAPGTTLEIDWIRLVDPTTSPVVRIQWSTSGAPANAQVNVVVDGSGSGSCAGEVLARQVPNGGGYDLRTASLPPGRYRVHLELVQVNGPGTALDVLATSSCSGEIRIGQAPTLRFTAPSPVSGEDYATAEVGNPWDMSDPTDVANLNLPLAQRWFENASFADGVFRATAIAPGANSQWSDVTLLMNGPEAVPINTQKYRYLTYRMWADTSHFTDIADYVTHGGGLRAIFFNQGLAIDGTDSRAALVYEDWHDYAIDLFDPNLPDPADKNAANLGWYNGPFVSTLHVDPLEVTTSSDFAFDEIGLRAENCTAGLYTVRWTITDPDSPALSVDLFADTAPDGPGDIHLVGPFTTAPGTDSVDVDLGTLAPGRYYIHAAVSDERQTRHFRARVPIVRPCDDFSPPLLEPRSGLWTPVAGGYAARGVGKVPAVALFTGVSGSEVLVSANARVKRGQPMFVFGYTSADDYFSVQIDTRRRRVAAHHWTSQKRSLIRAARLARTRRGRRTPVASGALTVSGGMVRVAVSGTVVLEVADPSGGGAVGLGLSPHGVGRFSAIRARALSAASAPTPTAPR